MSESYPNVRIGSTLWFRSGRPRRARVELGDVGAEHQGDRPVEQDADAAGPGAASASGSTPARRARRAGRRRGTSTACRSPRPRPRAAMMPKRLVDERLRGLAAGDGGQVLRQLPGLAEGVLGELRVGLAVTVEFGSGMAAQSPSDQTFVWPFGRAWSRSVTIRPRLSFSSGERPDQRRRRHAGDDDDRGIDGITSPSRSPLSSPSVAGRTTLSGSTRLTLTPVRTSTSRSAEDLGGVLAERLLDLGHDRRAGLDQHEPQVRRLDAAVVAGDVGEELGQLADELDADQPAADDDDGQQLPPGGPGRPRRRPSRTGR